MPRGQNPDVDRPAVEVPAAGTDSRPPPAVRRAVQLVGALLVVVVLLLVGVTIGKQVSRSEDRATIVVHVPGTAAAPVPTTVASGDPPATVPTSIPTPAGPPGGAPTAPPTPASTSTTSTTSTTGGWPDLPGTPKTFVPDTVGYHPGRWRRHATE